MKPNRVGNQSISNRHSVLKHSKCVRWRIVAKIATVRSTVQNVKCSKMPNLPFRIYPIIILCKVIYTIHMYFNIHSRCKWNVPKHTYICIIMIILTTLTFTFWRIFDLDLNVIKTLQFYYASLIWSLLVYNEYREFIIIL